MNQLSRNIRLLGDLLGQTIVEQAGQHVFDLEEQIRSLAKRWRDGDESAQAEIHRVIHQLAPDLPLTSNILNAFSTYFQLVNLAEEHERIRILGKRAEQAYQSNVPMDESVASAICTLKSEGFSADQVQDFLDRMLVMPVFTAHPTESKRRTTRQILQHISDSLKCLESPLEFQRKEYHSELAEYITLLWQSDESRRRRPTVMDEVRNNGLYFFEYTLFDVVPRIYQELEEALGQSYPGYHWRVPSMLRFGSWIGGDRDGNPFVTNQTTRSAIQAQQQLVLERYANDVQALYEMLSPAVGRAEFNPQFLTQLESEIAQLEESELETVMRFQNEPYRQKLILMYRRIMATRQRVSCWESDSEYPRAYASASEFLDDLQTIRSSLIENNSQILTRGRLARLIRRVQVFGFHLASLDIRQHSRFHQQALSEVFASYRVCEDYELLDEAERIEVLAREIENRRPLTASLNFSDSTNETISLFRMVAEAHQQAGTASIQAYVISMTESVSDVLEVLLLMSDADLFGKLDIVPLFETVYDLKAAPEIMSRLFAHPVYKRHLEARGNGQQIMIGYSDSNKDGGFLRANWMLFLAQRELADVCDQHDIRLTLFHGRGGSIGRGGGPANRAILAQPPASIRGRIRLTEQGEVVSSRYTDNAIAKRHLQQLLHAILCSSGRRPQVENFDRCAEVMDRLGHEAYCKYRELVEHPGFIDYFHSATPIDHIDSLNLGSRPARRGATESIDDLRAIPWVFAWTQSRTNIPSWYGVGTAINQWLAEGDHELSELQAMYQQWPFFNTMLNNVHLGMGRADINIAQLYSELVNPDHGPAIFENIRREFELTATRLLEVTGCENLLDTETWLQHSIRVRNPYVDPMNYIQVALLERYRSADESVDRDAVQDVILQSVNGIAGGLQNVG